MNSMPYENFRLLHLSKGKRTNLQKLRYKIDDFPDSTKFRIVKRSEERHDNIAYGWRYWVLEGVYYWNTVIFWFLRYPFWDQVPSDFQFPSFLPDHFDADYSVVGYMSGIE
jgi:hypothetical protein